MPLYPSFPQQSHPRPWRERERGQASPANGQQRPPKVKSHRLTSGCQHIALGWKPASLSKHNYFVKKQHNYFSTPTSGTVKFMTAACREGTQAAVSIAGLAGAAQRVVLRPADGAYWQRPECPGLLWPPGAGLAGSTGRAERSAEDPEPQHTDKWGSAHHWSCPIRDRLVCLKDLPVGAGVGGEGR